MKADAVGRNKVEARWEEGIWLGVQEVSGDHIIGTAAGCLKTKDLRRKPQEDRWRSEDMKKMKGTPWEPVPGHPDRELKSRVVMREEPILPPPQAEERQELMRRLYIRRKDVEKHGYTEGCEGCRVVSRGGVSRNHTEARRQRIEKSDQRGRRRK